MKAITKNKKISLYIQFDNDKPEKIQSGNGDTFIIELVPDNGFIEFVSKSKNKKFRIYVK